MVAGAVGCGGESAVPDQPTWVDDVAPILRANCFPCHGSTADYARYKTVRWDVYDSTDPRYAALGFVADPDPMSKVSTFVGAADRSHYRNIEIFISPDVPDNGRMPPVPATRLSWRDQRVLERWRETGFKQGTHSPNHPPTIEWLAHPTLFQVRDEDQDQVLGRLTCGERSVPIIRSGALLLPEGVSPPCTGVLFDGFDEASVDLR